MAGSEEEIYSIMFKSLKHPARRKILRMLSSKPMTFMEMVDTLGISTSHLTYHIENLGELVTKTETGEYKLSSFGVATVSAMKGVEEAPELATRQRAGLSFKWKTFLVGLIITVLLLSSVAAFQFINIGQLASHQESLEAENQQLLSWGVGSNKVTSFLQDIAQIDKNEYKITLLSNTIEYRSDIVSAEEIIRYSLTSSTSNLDIYLRFRNNHFSRYELTPIETAPILVQNQPSSILENAKATLERYRTYSNDSYLNEMSNLIAKVNTTGSTELTQGNLKLKIIDDGAGNGEAHWVYMEAGIEYPSKAVDMIFENRVLKQMTDGYFLFTVSSNTNLAISREEAVTIAKNYAKSLSWVINGEQIKGFNVLDEPVSVQMAPHPRIGTNNLIPYWYVVMKLDRTYSDGTNTFTAGIWGDTGEVVNVQMVSR
jgi:hypothetical protein